MLMPGATLPAISVSMRAASRLRAGHPWVYRSDLAAPGKSKTAEAVIPFAALVHVKDGRDRWLGTALASSTSQIALRMVSDKLLADDAACFALLEERITAALAWRKDLVHGS